MNRHLRQRRLLPLLATIPCLALAVGLAAPQAVQAGGHGGGYAVASGPAAVIPAPATRFYGGFAQTGYVNQASYYQAQPSPPAPAAETPRPASGDYTRPDDDRRTPTGLLRSLDGRLGRRLVRRPVAIWLRIAG